MLTLADKLPYGYYVCNMQKRIAYILLLMTCCVVLIIGLQFYWNYSNYKVTVSNLKKESNNALVNAVKIQQQFRRDQISSKIKRLMSDTSFLTITCNIDNRDSNTVFVINDTHPRFKEDTARKVSFYKAGINTFTKKLRKITPKAKEIFIEHFIKNLKRDLREGIIYYYTQGLGDSITAAINSSKFDLLQLTNIYKKELISKGINASAKIVSGNIKAGSSFFHTKKIDVSLVQFGKQDVVYGLLENPNQYYLKEMRWILLGTVLLIIVVSTCFYYTAKTLLSQQKLSLLKNQFVSNMTHEIHTPLTSIKITAEALQNHDIEEETKTEYLSIIQHQTDKLIALTNQLLNKARTENFEIDKIEDLVLDDLIRNVVKPMIDNGTKFTYADNKLIIKGNKIHLSNVFSNLIDNSIKYNQSSVKFIAVEVRRHKAMVQINFMDNGLGISAADVKHIFDPFYRVTENDTHNVKGYGLGLNYVKTVVEKHGGFIHVKSEIGKGSTFTINLPDEN